MLSSLHAMLLISKKTLSFLVFLSALVAVYSVRWLTRLDGVVVSSSCICVDQLVWTHAPFMHSAKHPKVGREGNFCSHPVHPSYTLPNTIRASYGSCFVEYCSTVLSVRYRPSSVNIDLTVHSWPDSRKSGTMLLHYCSYSWHAHNIICYRHILLH